MNLEQGGGDQYLVLVAPTCDPEALGIMHPTRSTVNEIWRVLHDTCRPAHIMVEQSVAKRRCAGAMAVISALYCVRHACQ